MTAHLPQRLAALLLVAPFVLPAQTSGPGKNTVTVRGTAVEVYLYKGAGSNHPKVLFAPGDGGWRGAAVGMAETMASWGYDVYGLDTKQYLMAFTGRTTLKETEVAEDVHRIAAWMAPSGTERVYLVGWSEGAGLMLLAAASGEHKEKYYGLITLGLGNPNVLGWRWKDNLTYITKKPPDEPSFSALSYMGQVAPLPVAMLQSTEDEYVSQEEAKKLFAKAQEPKRLVFVKATDHKFGGNQEQFFRDLQSALRWLAESRR